MKVVLTFPLTQIIGLDVDLLSFPASARISAPSLLIPTSCIMISLSVNPAWERKFPAVSLFKPHEQDCCHVGNPLIC